MGVSALKRGARRSPQAGERTPPAAAVVLGGWSAGTAVIRALGREGVPVYCVHHSDAEYGRASRYVVEAIRSPHPEEEPAAYVRLLLDLAERVPGSVLIPTSDEALTVVSRHRAALSERCAVACPEEQITELFMDKARTYALAEHIGVAVPRTFTVTSLEAATTAAEELGFPCLVKPRYGHRYHERFGRKMTEVHTPAQLQAVWHEATDAGLGVMVQEIVEGPDSSGANYNGYFADGRLVAECTAQKVRLNPPKYGFPRVVLSKFVPEIVKPSRRLVEALGLSGFACIEFKREAGSGEYKLMEVNGRHNMSAALSVRCGVNFPRITYDHLARGELPRPGRWRSGVFWIAESSDIRASVRLLREERYSLREYLRPYAAPHVFDMFDRADPAPMVQEVRQRLGRLLPGGQGTEYARGRGDHGGA